MKWYVIFTDGKEPPDIGPFDTEQAATSWAGWIGRAYRVRRLDPLSDPNSYKGPY